MTLLINFKYSFDNNVFKLRLINIDDILDTHGDPIMFEVDVAKTFRSLG